MYTDPLSNLFEVVSLESRVSHALAFPAVYSVVFPPFARQEPREHLVREQGIVDDEGLADPELYERACEFLEQRSKVSVELLRTELGIAKYADVIRLTDELERNGVLGPADPQLYSFCLVTRGSLGLQLGRDLIELGPHSLAIFPATSKLGLRDSKRRAFEHVHNLREKIHGYPPRLMLAENLNEATNEALVGRFRFRVHLFNPLAPTLSTRLVIPGSELLGSEPEGSTAPSRSAWLIEGLERTLLDTGTSYPGTLAAVESILRLLLIEALYFDAHRRAGPSWIRALGDPKLGEALRLIHTKPGHKWTDKTLGRRCGLRDAFESRFEREVGWKPQSYLSRWRIELAAQALANTHSEDPEFLARLARELGYGSEDAMSREFVRYLCVEPRRWAALVKPSVIPV